MLRVSTSRNYRERMEREQFTKGFDLGRRDCDQSVFTLVLQEISSGRAVNNFGHNPCCRRALEWSLMDVMRLQEERAKLKEKSA